MAFPIHSACSVTLCYSFLGCALGIAGMRSRRGVEFNVTIVVDDSVLDCDFAWAVEP